MSSRAEAHDRSAGLCSRTYNDDQVSSPTDHGVLVVDIAAVDRFTPALKQMLDVLDVQLTTWQWACLTALYERDRPAPLRKTGTRPRHTRPVEWRRRLHLATVLRCRDRRVPRRAHRRTR